MRMVASTRFPARAFVANLPFIFALVVALPMIFWYAPVEQTMGDVQRIVYLHVSVAWCGLAGCVAMGMCGIAYLLRRDIVWDHWSQAAGEIGWLGATLTLLTGSLWAHEAWGVWWTWEPRLTFSLVLWLIYAGVFLIRNSVEDTHRRARIGAVLAVLGAADAPLVYMATRWFRGVHPVAPQMDPAMRLVLIVAVVAFSATFVRMAILRRRQLGLANRVFAMECTTGHGEGDQR
jgi:heme exporter protein C